MGLVVGAEGLEGLGGDVDGGDVEAFLEEKEGKAPGAGAKVGNMVGLFGRG